MSKKTNSNHEQFLDLLRRRYDSTKEKAVDELIKTISQIFLLRPRDSERVEAGNTGTQVIS